VLKNPFEVDGSSTRDTEQDDEEVQGTVNRIENYGAFVTLLDGSVGLLHRSETPRGLRLELGDCITCKIKIRQPKLALTMLTSQENLAAMAVARTPVKAIVTNVRPFGAFVDLGGISGLLHRSETELLPGQPIPWEIGEMLHVRLLGSPGPKLAVTAKPLYLLPERPRQLHDGDVDFARLCCFHSKENCTEAVLGVGVSLEAEEVNGPVQKHHLTSIYDVLAHGSFQDGVRRGVWKQKFFAFLPLAIDSEHFLRAQSAFQESIAKLASGTVAQKTQSHGKSREERDAEYAARLTLDEYRKLGSQAAEKVLLPSMCRPRGSPFVPEMIFEVLPKLMNSQVVLLSTGQLWRCQKALEGYFAYHHLLLHCLKAFPALRTTLETMMETFQEDPKGREKGRVHNIGEFLCLLSVSDRFDWDSMGVQILEEVFDRNVLWILRQSPHLGNVGVSAASDEARLRASFRANRVSLRLLMFQVAFLRLAKPVHFHGLGAPPCTSASCALERKDHCKGLPGPGEAEWLFDQCLEILAVEDFSGFLELVGAAPMTDTLIARWLRRSVLRSIEKGYHNPAIFKSLARKAVEATKPVNGGEVDPEDFACDNRAKESKADKRARKRAAQLARASLFQRQNEYQRALNWARFYSPHGYRPRQCISWLFNQSDVDMLLSVLGANGVLRERFNGALAGYCLLNGVTTGKLEQASKFPMQVWLGLGCIDCGKAASCEISGRCMPCCHRAAKEPAVAKPIKGLTGSDAPVAQYTAFQAEAEMRPVQFEMHLEVPFDGLVADLKPLRAMLSEDLVVKDKIQGGTIFSLVSRCGKKLWEKSPEQSIFPGSKLTAGWQGVTDAVFRAKIRNINFVLLQDTMHNVTTLEDLGLLRMTRPFCKDHALETVLITIGLHGVSFASLKADNLLRQTLKEKIRTIFGIHAEIANPKSYVDIVLSDIPGHGMSVAAKIIPPTGSLASTILSRLNTDGLGKAVVDIVATSMPRNSHTATDSRLTIAGVSVPKIIRVCPGTLEDPEIQEAAQQRSCANCRGVLRLRFNAPCRFAERRSQLEDLTFDQLAQRAQLCGLADECSNNGASHDGRKATMNLNVKSEGIIR
jgi:hypothetical protein